MIKRTSPTVITGRTRTRAKDRADELGNRVIRSVDSVSELHARIDERRVLLGCSIDSASPAVAEMAGLLGYEIVWADLEHGNVDPRAAELFCQCAKAGGALPLLRIQSPSRTHVLLALETGARLVVVPMVESPETSRKIVEHGKFSPLGKRGFNGSSRGMRWGIGGNVANMRWADRETHLFVQIETLEAVRRCAEIVSVEGISGGVIGPGDLSVSMGKPLAFGDPAVVKAVSEAIRVIRAQNKIAVAVTSHPTLVKASIEAGVQILICAGERPSLRAQFERTYKEMVALAR